MAEVGWGAVEDGVSLDDGPRITLKGKVGSDGAKRDADRPRVGGVVCQHSVAPCQIRCYDGDAGVGEDGIEARG